MKRVFLLVRVVLFVVGLFAVAYLSLELRKKWDREAVESPRVSGVDHLQ